MPNTAKAQSARNGKQFLRERFIDVEQEFLALLRKNQREITHDGTLGDATEDAWIKLLRDYLPTRYKVAKAFAVDHLGNTTQQLDCLIFDAHFTPALFGKENHLYVPAEAVYASFEIKQIVNAAHLKAAGKKIESLRVLQRTSAPLPYAKQMNPPKEPFRIIGGLLGMEAEWKDGLGKSFLTQLQSLKREKSLDFVLTAGNGYCESFDCTDPRVISGSGALIRGLFQLLHHLRARASVVAIDWQKYDAVFTDPVIPKATGSRPSKTHKTKSGRRS